MTCGKNYHHPLFCGVASNVETEKRRQERLRRRDKCRIEQEDKEKFLNKGL